MVSNDGGDISASTVLDSFFQPGTTGTPFPECNESLHLMIQI